MWRHPFFCTTYSAMKTLDLHGASHLEAYELVEEFVLLNETPLKIITGQSTKMRTIVREITEKHQMYCFHEYFSNFGAYIIQDKTKI